jgi:hypothetical protein
VQGIDLVLDYRGEDRPAFVKFTGNVWVTQKTCIPFCITATLHSLTGKVRSDTPRFVTISCGH